MVNNINLFLKTTNKMKKMFIIGALALFTLAITSCDPNKVQCWKLNVKYSDGKSMEYYFYGSGVEADAQLEIYRLAGATQIGREQTFRSKNDCHN